jgi:hypothetical protein
MTRADGKTRCPDCIVVDSPIGRRRNDNLHNRIVITSVGSVDLSKLNTTKVLHGVRILVSDKSHFLVGPSGKLGVKHEFSVFASVLSSKDMMTGLVDWDY